MLTARRTAFEQDWYRGKRAEERILPLLEPFLGALIRIPQETHNFDFEGEFVWVELKERTCRKDYYDTTVVPYCKIKWAETADKPCYFVFSFTDGIYWIKYEKSLFDTYEVVPDFAPHRRSYNKKTPTPHIKIAVEDLKSLGSLPTLNPQSASLLRSLP